MTSSVAQLQGGYKKGFPVLQFHSTDQNGGPVDPDTRAQKQHRPNKNII